MMDEEIRQVISEVREMKQMCGNINMKLTNIVTQRGQDWKKKLEAEYQRGLEHGKAVNDKGCEGCKYSGTLQGDSPCFNCSNYYTNNWTARDDKIKVRDQVIWTQDENVAIVVTSVYTKNNMEWCDGVCKDGKVYSILTENARKTGGRFDIDKYLEEINRSKTDGIC